MLKPLSFFFFFISFLSVFSQNKTNNYIAKYSHLAIDEMRRYHIPASITLAQGVLESGNGESRLAVEGNNHFGIKCHDNWNGETINDDDDEKGECFRKYDKAADSYRDHSLFLTERERYTSLFSLSSTNYKAWAKGLKKAGYATNPKYPTLLIDLIHKYDLSRFDNEVVQKKNLFFSHSYGFPYLSGIGVYYFKKKSLYIIEVNTSFVFSSASLAFNYGFFNDFYIGANSGIIYQPTKKEDIIPIIASELIYKKSSEKHKFDSILIRGGVQIPLAKIDCKFIPYLRLTYLLK